MFTNKIYILYFTIIFLNIVAPIQTLVELPIVEDNNIAIIETAIRNTVNNLFAAFKIEDLKHNHRLKQFSTIHNFFVSITLKDCENLKEIARLTRVNNIDNNTQYFITQINEVLNEDDKSNEAGDSNNLYVTRYINMFIRKLKYLKNIHVPDGNIGVNTNILQYLNNHGIPLSNFTDHINNVTHSSAENVLSENEFWRPSGRRIYDGIRTGIKSFPFIASIHFFKKFQCAGSIIKNDLIITSASCLQLAWNNRFFRENPSFLSVQVGSDKYESGGDNIAVFEIHFHPHYDPKDLRNNLAIMRLTRKIALKQKKRRVQKIDYDKNPWPMPLNAGRITVIGWGAKDSNNIITDVFSNILSYAELDYYPQMDCQEHYSEEFVTEKNFCAGFYSVGAGACNRDAGGPGIIDDTLMGVISFGSPICGAPDSPTVFTKLGYYTSWIENIMEQTVPHKGKSTTTLPPKTIYEMKLPHFTKPVRDITPFPELPIVTSAPNEPINLGNELRISEDTGFKDFLSTMFNSQELAEYFDDSPEVKMTAKKEVKPITKQEIKHEKASVKKKSTKKVIKPNIERTTHHEDYIETSDESSMSPEVIDSNITPQRSVTIIENASNDDDDNSKIKDSLENDIMKLIDKLDIDKIISNKKSVTTALSYVNILNKNHKSKQVMSTSSSSENENNKNSHERNVINYLFISSEKRDDEDGGLSIATENFKDLTFREGLNSNKTKNALTASSFAELISLAIDEEAKKIKRHYIL